MLNFNLKGLLVTASCRGEYFERMSQYYFSFPVLYLHKLYVSRNTRSASTDFSSDASMICQISHSNFFSSTPFFLKVSLPHANCHSTTGLHIFISDELEDEGKLKKLSAYLPAYTASYMRRRKSKLYSWMIDYKLGNFLMFCNVISIQPQP